MTERAVEMTPWTYYVTWDVDYKVIEYLKIPRVVGLELNRHVLMHNITSN